ncbi:MAG: T9SS type A sorting domain-containing protein [Candidatus Eisenbacteria bacterium]|nr:T9SS type A sorting domain-containing protein [Candidatus Eisenbacteria bacterium]
MRRPPHASPGSFVGHICRTRILRSAAVLAFAIAAGIFAPGRAAADQVTGIQARNHDGQTFVTWISLPGTGWKYLIYKSSSPIRTAADLAAATLAGSVGDSSWYDRRLSTLTGTVYGYRTDSTAKPLNFVRSLFVSTADDAAGGYYYAVTAQAASGSEDRSLTWTANALDVPVFEAPALPRPVYQYTLQISFMTVDVYTLWTSSRAHAQFPEMSNRESTPYDCAVVRGGDAPVHALVFRPHVRGGSFLDVAENCAGEWDLTMDDYLGTPDVNTFWFGYHENYDITSTGNLPPLTGHVCDYTMQRVIYTLEWARRTLPIDPGRVYVNGASMGGICGVFLAMTRPDLVAAVMVNIARFDFSSEADPNVPTCAFNTGSGQRTTCDRLWGTVDTDLPTDDGTLVFNRLNAGFLARQLANRYVPPIIAFNGRNDVIVGWAEKPIFYGVMRDTRAGGQFYWDTRTHWSSETAAWKPMFDYMYIYRYRSDRSFPALSNCSADNNAGNGMATSGDSVGTINGYVEWDPTVIDDANRWQVSLHSRTLQTLWGALPPPDSMTVDVTPRRLQSFVVTPLGAYTWSERNVGGVLVATGRVLADVNGIITVPGVPVYRTGGTLQIQPASFLAVDPIERRLGLAPSFAPVENPVHGSFSITVRWARDGEAALDLVDLSGRNVRHIASGTFAAGPRTVAVDAGDLASGIYFLTARQNGVARSQRIALLR